MTGPIQLVLVQGPYSGKTFPVLADGVRIGRIAKNDIMLDDPLVSRFHCRIYTKADSTLWVADLGSSNQTLLNGKPIQESRLSHGDRVTVGESVFRIQIGEQESPMPGASADPTSAVDLGLASERTHKAGPGVSRTSLIILGVLLLVLAGGITLLALRSPRKANPRAPGPQAQKTLEIEYEKVQASTGGIFRYSLQVTPDRKIRVEIDNTEKTHVQEESPVNEDLLQDLSTFIQQSGFFALADEYVGPAPNFLERAEISVTIGRKTQRISVANRVEPPAFKKVREKLEEFGKVELGIWAIQYAPEKLLAMAHDAYQLARKMYDEREVAYGNLAQAIKSYKDAEFCLRTVEPKPDYYPEILAGTSICEEDMEKRYNNQSFLATRAINLKAWEDAARELRVIIEMIPEVTDPRAQEARQKLLEVENRMNKRK